MFFDEPLDVSEKKEYEFARELLHMDKESRARALNEACEKRRPYREGETGRLAARAAYTYRERMLKKMEMMRIYMQIVP